MDYWVLKREELFIVAQFITNYKLFLKNLRKQHTLKDILMEKLIRIVNLFPIYVLLH